jgi:UDP-4-amino-4-deoxy-L-arabinose-oxoglutarate aminotransferase
MKAMTALGIVDIPHSKPWLSEEDSRAVQGVLSSSMLAEGEKVHEFEAAVSERIGAAGGVATSSGTAALALALKTLNIGPKDEVVIPTYVCRAVYNAVKWTGASPVLCDVTEEWCMTPEIVTPRLSARTKAVVVVHAFGIASPVDGIAALGVPVVEDLAQAFGGSWKGAPLGSLGVMSVCSFHATKTLCTGEGGMVLAREEKFLGRLRDLAREGVRFPFSNLQAALGLSQLSRYDRFLARRRDIAQKYFTSLNNLSLRLPEGVKDKSMFFRFPLRMAGGKNFDTVRATFEQHRVHVRRGVDALLHPWIGLDPRDYPGAERCFAETLSIPLYPAMSDEEVEAVVAACRRVFGG